MLRAEVLEGSVIFVRLLQSAAAVNNIPIAFQIMKVATKMILAARGLTQRITRRAPLPIRGARFRESLR